MSTSKPSFGGTAPYDHSVHNLKKVKLSFYDPFSVYPKIQKELESKLPLTNLHWKASDKSPLRSIPCLDVDIVEEIPKTSKSAPLIKTIDEQMQRKPATATTTTTTTTKEPASLLKRASTIIKPSSSDVSLKSFEGNAQSQADTAQSSPLPQDVDSFAYEADESALTDLIKSINDSYLKIMFFEAQNIEHYKQNVRPFIKEWFKQSVDNSKLPTDWLLIFYIPQGGKDDYTTAFKYGLLDKIKLDFSNYSNASFMNDTVDVANGAGINNANGLKILKLKHDYPSINEQNQAWNAFLHSVKTGILNTFTERVNFFDYKISKFLNSFSAAKGTKTHARNGSIVSKIDNRPVFSSEMNIGLYFMMNENLGILYHDLSLYEDSLIQYDNLEKIFEFYLRRHEDNHLDLKFLTNVGFEDDLEKNLFYFNIYKSLQNSSFQDDNDNSNNNNNNNNNSVPGFTVTAYEQIAPKIFKSLTDFNNPIFETLRKKILSNDISYFEMKNYFFLKKITLITSIIFNNFSQLSSTPSVNSVYIYDLLSRLKTFIIEANFEVLNFKGNSNHIDLLKLAEFCFTMIDNYLLFINEYFFKPPQKTTDPEARALPPLGNKSYSVYSKSKEINDIIGELRLTQRFFLVILAKFYGYKIDSVTIDQLVDIKLSAFLKNNSLSNEDKTTTFQFNHPLLARIFSKFENFANYFKYLTESAIANFNISDKPRNVDILSIDIALLNYQIGNYNDSLLVLLNCPNFYNEQGWEYIGFYLLKVFVSCLEKVLKAEELKLETLTAAANPSNTENSTITKEEVVEEIDKLRAKVSSNKVLLFKSYLDLLSTLIDSSETANKMTEISLTSATPTTNIYSNSNFINNNLENISKYLTDPRQIDSILQNALKLKNEVELQYDLNKIFKYKVHPFVVSRESNVYCVELDIENLTLFLHENATANDSDLNIFDFDKIELTMQNISDSGELVTFKFDKQDYASNEDFIKENFILRKGNNKITLSTRDIIVGRFAIKDIKVVSGGITLIRELIKSKREFYDDNSNINDKGDVSVQEGSSIGEQQFEEKLVYESKDIFLIHPYINNLHFELKNPLSLNLNYKQFLVKINIGDFEIDNGVLEFSTSSGAFQLIDNDLKAVVKKRIPKFVDGQNGEFDYDDDSLFDVDSATEIEISSELTEQSQVHEGQVIFKIGKVDKNSIVDVIIPYTMNETKFSNNSTSAINKNIINLKTKMTYESNNKQHSLISYQDLNTTLTIAVSVQDTFKSQNLFSKFSVGTAELKTPIRILSTDLLSNDNYKTCTALKPPPLVAFGEQPASYFFKISPVDPNYVAKSDDALRLIVNYRNLSEEVFELAWQNFKLTYLLNKSNETHRMHISKYILLLKDYLFKLLRFDLNEYALLNKLKIKHFDIFEFAELFTHFFPEDRSKYLCIFKQFIESVKKDELDLSLENFVYTNSTKRYDDSDSGDEKEANIDKFFANINRELYIDVPIPLVQVVHNVSLEFEQKSQYVVGDPIMSKFKIQSLVNWRGEEPNHDAIGANDKVNGDANASGKAKTPKKKRVLFEDPNKDSLIENFQLDFVGPQENWLISGKKKFQFSLNKQGAQGGNNDGSSSSSSIVQQPDNELYLVPLKVGRLILPKIEIKSTNNHLNDEFTMEVDYKNSSQTVLVVPNLDRVTFAF